MHLKPFNLPFYHVPLDLEFPWEELTSQLAHEYETRIGSNTGYNLILPDCPIFRNLYNVMLDKVVDILGPIKILPKNSTRCWLYVTNKDNQLYAIHDHAYTAIVNAVYYINVPKGDLVLFNSDEKEIARFTPKRNDLVIFPGTMLHAPEVIDGDESRVSVNMEIICEPVNWV
jgi:hypothetical protein